jgi:hypothetical protein
MIIIKADMPVRYEAETKKDADVITEALKRQGCSNIQVSEEDEMNGMWYHRKGEEDA